MEWKNLLEQVVQALRENVMSYADILVTGELEDLATHDVPSKIHC